MVKLVVAFTFKKIVLAIPIATAAVLVVRTILISGMTPPLGST